MPQQKEPKTGTQTLGTGSRGWTTDDQKKYLEERIPQYLATKIAKTTDDFWAQIFIEWLQKWSLPPLTPKEIVANLTDAE